MIRKVGEEWCLFTADGSRKLGCHETRADALAQERAVQANKNLPLLVYEGAVLLVYSPHDLSLVGTMPADGDAAKANGNGNGDGKFEEQDFYAEAVIVKALDEERLAFGVFLVPWIEDLQGDVLSDAQVRKAAHQFMMRLADRERGPIGFVRVRDMHRTDVKAHLVESFLAPPGGMNWHGRFIPEGTWAGTVKVHDDEMWSMVKRGLRRGFSVRMRGRKLVEVPA